MEDRHDQARKLILCKTMDMGREKSSNVMLEAMEKDATDGALKCKLLLILGLLCAKTGRRAIGGIALWHFLLQPLLPWAGRLAGRGG